jgi:hypothetical protein
MPGIAKPQFLAMLLQHMSRIRGGSPRGILEDFPAGMWDRTREMVDAINPEKLGTVLGDAGENRFIPKADYESTVQQYGLRREGAWVAGYPPDVPGGPASKIQIAMPLASFKDYGPSLIPHELRHVEQDLGKYGGAQGDTPIIASSNGYFMREPTTNNLGMIADPMEALRMHHSPRASEIDAALSETATLEKLGDLDMAKYFIGQRSQADMYKKVWNRLPDFIKQHYRKTVGVAAPVIGGFQPETQE